MGAFRLQYISLNSPRTQTRIPSSCFGPGLYLDPITRIQNIIDTPECLLSMCICIVKRLGPARVIPAIDPMLIKCPLPRATMPLVKVCVNAFGVEVHIKANRHTPQMQCQHKPLNKERTHARLQACATCNAKLEMVCIAFDGAVECRENADDVYGLVLEYECGTVLAISDATFTVSMRCTSAMLLSVTLFVPVGPQHHQNATKNKRSFLL